MTRHKKVMPFRFLDLPPELRNHVYEYALIDSTMTDRLRPRREPRKKHDRITAITRRNLLATCRQIRKEAPPVYYGSNHFATDGRENEVRQWLRAIGKNAVHALRSLVVDYSWDVCECMPLDSPEYSSITIKLSSKGTGKSRVRWVEMTTRTVVHYVGCPCEVEEEEELEEVDDWEAFARDLAGIFKTARNTKIRWEAFDGELLNEQSSGREFLDEC